MLRDAFLADLGELAGPLTHEVNNLLNTMTMALQLAALQHTGPLDLAPDFQALRRQINTVAGVVMRFQRYRGQQLMEPSLLDVNVSLRNVVNEMPLSAIQTPIRLELQPELPSVRGYEADVRRLCRFLLANAVRALSPDGPPVMARTSCAEGTVFLQVEDAGPNIPAEALPLIFDPGHEQREGMCCLELAACRSIVRRMNGSLQAHARPGGGLIVTAKVLVET